MSRFKDLCSSSGSDSEQETQQSYQRGRMRQNKKFTQISNKKDDQQSQTKKQTLPIVIKKQPQKDKSSLCAIKQTPTNLWIETNQYKSNSSLNINEKFIRENIKPAQQQMKHYLQKMRNTLQQRKKFISALAAAGRDLQKVNTKIQEVKATLNGDNNDEKSRQNYQFNQKSSISQNKTNNKPNPQNLATVLKLQSKIQRHLSNLLTEHHKTIQTLILCRKQVSNYFNKVRFSFLDLNSISLFDQQTQAYQEYGIEQMYRIIQQADSIINQQTSFMK